MVWILSSFQVKVDHLNIYFHRNSFIQFIGAMLPKLSKKKLGQNWED